MSEPIRTAAPVSHAAPPFLFSERGWGIAMLVPCAALFLMFTLYPVLYGLWLGLNPASYTALWNNPIYLRTFCNTLFFIFVVVNLKMLFALGLSGLFVSERRRVRWLSALLVLPWALPSVPSVLTFRWMFNSEWGLVNNLLLLIGIDGPQWLIRPEWAMTAICATHIWKYMPFWVIALVAGRMGIPGELYDAARVDGASRLQIFRHITWPGLRSLYLTNTLVATIWALGDFNTVYLLTGGGPMDRTHTLATLGFRYAFVLSDMKTGIAAMFTMLPLLVPLIWLLGRRISRKGAL